MIQNIGCLGTLGWVRKILSLRIAVSIELFVVLQSGRVARGHKDHPPPPITYLVKGGD